jgi:ribulose-phosphate 3-epimerase
MSVEPGFGGQKFMEDSLEKIKYFDELRNNNDEYTYQIEVDGGINLDNVSKVRFSGANIVVMGTALINSCDKKNVISKVEDL